MKSIMLRSSNPFSTFLVIHFEVGGDTRNLEHQKNYWPITIDLIKLANRYNAKLTLQFNPQWAEYLLKDKSKFNLIKEWQKQGHEVGLHHHGYDHGNWNGYTNRPDKENDPRFRGRIRDMIELMRALSHPYQLLCGTITDEEYDYPDGIKYDTEGIQLSHARTRPKRVVLGGKEVIQIGIAFLSFAGDIEAFKQEYLRAKEDEIFGVVTHEIDFAKNREIIKEWLSFVSSIGGNIQTPSKIINSYLEKYPVEYSDAPLIFSKNVMVL